jgi:transposase
MQLYAGIDLHASNNYLAVIDENGKRIFKQRLPNESEVILLKLGRFQEEMAGVVVESTFNWYWLVDLLQEAGYRVNLANPAAIQKYTGLKHSDDKHDAFWLAEMLRLGILPKGYIYPKEERPVRDLLRKRGHLVRLRTSLILSLQNIIVRSKSIQLNSNDIKNFRITTFESIMGSNEDLATACVISKESIDFLTERIKAVESIIEQKVKLKDQYRHLLTIPGIGKILALTIMLETGSVERFPKVGDYVSYCRKVNTKWTSNEKKKGKGNKKNGNKYLAWAFSEAAEIARRYNTQCLDWYNRKKQKANFMVAHQALAHKLARAAYCIMKENVAYMPGKLFSV